MTVFSLHRAVVEVLIHGEGLAVARIRQQGCPGVALLGGVAGGCSDRLSAGDESRAGSISLIVCDRVPRDTVLTEQEMRIKMRI